MDDRSTTSMIDLRSTQREVHTLPGLLRLAQTTPWVFWMYLLMITAAELLTSLISPMIGLVSHIVLMVGLLVHAALGRTEEERKLALALVLAPMIRLLSLSLPLINFPQEAWYPMTSVPLLAATWIIVRQHNIRRQELGLRTGHASVSSRARISLQLMIAGGGLGLGAIEYAILAPEPLVASFSWGAVVLAGLSLAIFTGFNEELIFRGLLQAVCLPVLRRWALVYMSLLFGALHIGYLSVLDVVFVTVVGLVFAYIVRWSGSILGVTLAHGLTNITLFLIMPYLVRESAEVRSITGAVAVAGMLASVGATAIFWRQYRRAANASQGAVAPIRQESLEAICAARLAYIAAPARVAGVRSRAEPASEPST